MRKRPAVRALEYGLLLAAVTFFFFPVLVTIVSSFKRGTDIFSYVPKVLFTPTLENYANLFTHVPDFLKGLRNSVVVTSSSTLLALAIALPAALGYSRFNYGGVKKTAFFVIAVRMFPTIIIGIPIYPFVMRMGLLGDPTVLIVMIATFQLSMTTLLLKSFVDAVPQELDEAAMIDGCGYFKAFLRIVMPIIAPGTMAAAIFVTLAAWNEYQFALIFTSERSRTAPVIIADILYNAESGALQTRVTWGGLFAACTIQLLPVMFYIWFVQRNLFKGFTIGAVKG